METRIEYKRIEKTVEVVRDDTSSFSHRAGDVITETRCFSVPEKVWIDGVSVPVTDENLAAAKAILANQEAERAANRAIERAAEEATAEAAMAEKLTPLFGDFAGDFVSKLGVGNAGDFVGCQFVDAGSLRIFSPVECFDGDWGTERGAKVVLDMETGQIEARKTRYGVESVLWAFQLTKAQATATAPAPVAIQTPVVVNLTPHPVTVRCEDGTETVFPASGVVARVASSQIHDGEILGIQVRKNSFGEVTFSGDLPPADFYIVSALVLSAANRKDFIQPDTSPTGAIRDAEGKIVAVRGFLR